ncbi:uncharacterized protein N7500_000768 [Penicillium coprophilum]|uniref:uncharacterized protein n=1 Tax=Penicillium coprophilum TaxID=36646 RepID=UPI0023884E57|nr:uncharacterized protein N7500_000768 [Penicillium coprophilum]KAJ5178069.1 hypothetical protein N7500_000768 [Penicillium coprophilum]
MTPPASYTRAFSLVDSIAGSHHVDEDREAEPDLEQDRAYYTAHGQFADRVAAAIDVRAGSTPIPSHQIPLVDAPLFGDLDLSSNSCVLLSSTELPPRAYADQLIDIYWQHIDPMEPVLDRQRFLENYGNVYATSVAPLSANYDHRRTILNLVFALAVQRQEQIPRYQRNKEGNCFFQRAWALLPAESMLWQPGSLELVQCLMLMNRYLHCTNNQQKTWMTAGLAMRIAQSMCCHLPESPFAMNPSDDKALKQKIWASCVALDRYVMERPPLYNCHWLISYRCISWSLGKTSALVLIPSPPTSSNQRLGHNSIHNNWGLDLHEIGNQIQLAQIQMRTSLAARFRPPLLSQQDEYHKSALQLDAYLRDWENNLPGDWQLQNLKMVSDRSHRAERYVLHLRCVKNFPLLLESIDNVLCSYLHHRIFLYRPMLARFYSIKADTSSLGTPSLSHRLLRECASMCIEAAQNVVSLVKETLEPDEPIGLLPWWYRIYYLHIAGSNFLAAMFRSDLFTASVSQSWENVLLALHAHEHLSPYIQQCVWTFEALAAKITSKPYPGLDGSGCDLMVDGSASVCFDDIFKDVDFDFDNFIFGPEEFGEGLL